MKQPKKLTRQIKIALSKKKLNAENWALVTESNESFTVINKKTKKIHKFMK